MPKMGFPRAYLARVLSGAVLALLCSLALTATARAVEVLKKMPCAGELHRLQENYVDGDHCQ
jgi:hypothetical protein